MTRRRAFRWSAALGLLVGAGVGLVLLTESRRVDHVQTYHRVQTGMTQADVEGVIGVPPGDYLDLPPNTQSAAFGEYIDEAGTRLAELAPGWRLEQWEWADCRIQVFFDRAGKTVRKTLTRMERSEPTWIERIRRRLGW